MIFLTVLFIALGFIGLYFSAKLLIKSLEDIANHFGVSHILVGLTILSIGTSLPEIAVSFIGGLDKLAGINSNIDGIIIGNKVGSFLIQITVIIGLLALSKPLTISKWELKREGIMMFISLIVFVLLALDGVLSQIDALIMIIIYSCYMIFIIWSERKISHHRLEVINSEKYRLDTESFEVVETPLKNSTIKKDILLFMIGLILLLISAEITILNAHSLAKELNVPENVIGILILGLGTSIPELIADLTAIRRRSYGIAIGDILGSNICDILLATGSGAILTNFNVAPVLLIFDVPMLFIAISLVCYLLWTEKTLKRWEGILLICFYANYVVLKLVFFQTIII